MTTWTRCSCLSRSMTVCNPYGSSEIASPVKDQPLLSDVLGNHIYEATITLSVTVSIDAIRVTYLNCIDTSRCDIVRQPGQRDEGYSIIDVGQGKGGRNSPTISFLTFSLR